MVRGVNVCLVAVCIYYSVSQKNPPGFSGIFSQTVGNFSIKLYVPVVRSNLRSTTNFLSITFNFDEVMPY